VEKLNYWDRNAPYPADLDKTFTWDEAKELVLGAYEKFSPRMAKNRGAVL
jgi:oligoendopeptidase F